MGRTGWVAAAVGTRPQGRRRRAPPGIKGLLAPGPRLVPPVLLCSPSATQRGSRAPKGEKENGKHRRFYPSTFPRIWKRQSHPVTLMAVLPLKSAVSLPEAHSLPLLPPSFAGNVQRPSSPEPLTSHRLLGLSLLARASGRTTEGQEPGHIPVPTPSFL